MPVDSAVITTVSEGTAEMDHSCAQNTAGRARRVAVRFLSDEKGGHPYYTLRAPSLHALIMFLALAGDARAALSVLQPHRVALYVAAYAGCVIGALALGAAVRAKKDDYISRLCSATLGFAGFDTNSFVTATGISRDAPPAAAGYAPAIAGLIVVVASILAWALTRMPSTPAVGAPRTQKKTIAAAVRAPKAWRMPIFWLVDAEGRHQYWTVREPSWHTMIFFIGAAGNARLLLEVVDLHAAPIYIAVYAACVAIALVFASAVRGKTSETTSRLCSGALGFLGFDANSFVTALPIDFSKTMPPVIAGDAPAITGLVIVFFSALMWTLARVFPAPVPQPKAARTGRTHALRVVSTS